MFDAFMPVFCVLTMEIFLSCNSLCYEWGGFGCTGQLTKNLSVRW